MRLVFSAALCLLLPACSCSDDAEQGPSDSGPSDAGQDGGPDAAVDAGEDAGTPPTFCETLGLPERDFDPGPYGTARHDVADDLTVEQVSGSAWQLSEAWTGCESYVFVPDTIGNSALDPTSIWERDIDRLIEGSPRNVHYFFVSRLEQDFAVNSETQEMQEDVENFLGSMDPVDAEHWRAHLHVVPTKASALGGWLQEILVDGIGRYGFAIDRMQRIRGIGSLSDVNRYSAALAGAGQWPWESNLAYAAHEARRYDFEALRQERLDAEDATVVQFWDGEILAEFEEIDVELPTAEQMAAFDTLEIDVSMDCPEAGDPEFGNCGAWDYLAYLFVYDAKGARIELGRFITSYHRENRMVVDATPMLVHLAAGGTRRFRWEFAPPWNTQPTATRLSLRFSNQARGYAPSDAAFLFAGGGFNSTYNDGRLPIDVPIPADAARVELWAILTGHGGETNNCAEFCDHEHEFTVEGATYTRDHPMVGDGEGCIGEIERGMVPNQWGTWWFGRGGWCPGEQVDPWVVDVTADVTPGDVATVSYRGLYDGATPPDASGNIVLTSYLVVYR